MKGRWGLQAKMTASYVAVTAGAVLAAEVVIIGIVGLNTLTAVSRKDLQLRAQTTAVTLASKLGAGAASGRLPVTRLGQPGVTGTRGLAQPDKSGGVLIPQITSNSCDPGPASFAVVVAPPGTILASSYPACYPPGTSARALPAAPKASLHRALTAIGSSSTGMAGATIWARQPVLAGPGSGKPGTTKGGAAGPTAGGSGPQSGQKVFGELYLQIPAQSRGAPAAGTRSALLHAGLLVLALSVPVGLIFGLLSTRRLTRRLKRLAAETLEVADGAFGRRIPVSGADEVSRLEGNFNRMAERLQASLEAERQLAGANARHEERSRIARELHDSISQDLFSLSMLAGGLRRALPSDAPGRAEVETMERTAGTAMREMQALLLELRPVALAEAGLAAAVSELCRAYRERLGIDVRAELDPVAIAAEREHATLRVIQEALANAVRHASPATIRIRLTGDGDRTTLEVSDDGKGFDPDADGGPPGTGLGLRAMRDRVREQGGELAIASVPGAGTVVRVVFPA